MLTLDISKLVEINNQEKPGEDVRKASLDQFPKEKTMLNKIKSFCHVHKASIDFCTVVDGLDHGPGAHGGGAAGRMWLSCYFSR